MFLSVSKFWDMFLLVHLRNYLLVHLFSYGHHNIYFTHWGGPVHLWVWHFLINPFGMIPSFYGHHDFLIILWDEPVHLWIYNSSLGMNPATYELNNLNSSLGLNLSICGLMILTHYLGWTRPNNFNSSRGMNTSTYELYNFRSPLGWIRPLMDNNFRSPFGWTRPMDQPYNFDSLLGESICLGT